MAIILENSQSPDRQSGTGNTSPCTGTPDVETGDDEKIHSEDQKEDWEDDPRNPYNWPTKSKVLQVLMMASAAFTT